MEVWLHGFALPGRVVELARWAESAGFDGLLLADSQNLTADIWVELALAAAATSTLRLGPGATNPVTRHLAVTASAATTLQSESAGRVVLGLARGDSALSLLGLRHMPVAAFEAQLETLQGLLRGEQVTLDTGTAAALRWIAATGAAKVPVHVAATGPRMIAAAARRAEGVDLTVGAAPDRLRECVALASSATAARPSLGAYLNVAVDDDAEAARTLVRGSVATFARFSAEQAPAGYVKEQHGQAQAGFAQHLDDDFIDAFALSGSALEVGTRLREIATCGIERVILVPGSLDSDPTLVRRSLERFAAEVLPALR